MAKLNLSAPWILYYRKVDAMFKQDNGVNVIFDEENRELKLYVDDAFKAEAIDYLLPATIPFGDTALRIEVIPPNTNGKIRLKGYSDTPEYPHPKQIFENAFYENPAFVFTTELEGVFSNPITYVVFEKKVVQFFSDDLSDYFGQYSTLYQEIAKDIFRAMNGVYYCTNNYERRVAYGGRYNDR